MRNSSHRDGDSVRYLIIQNQITLYYITLCLTTAHHMVPHHIALYHIILCYIESRYITSYRMISHCHCSSLTHTSITLTYHNSVTLISFLHHPRISISIASLSLTHFLNHQLCHRERDSGFVTHGPASLAGGDDFNRLSERLMQVMRELLSSSLFFSTPPYSLLCSTPLFFSLLLYSLLLSSSLLCSTQLSSTVLSS